MKQQRPIREFNETHPGSVLAKTKNSKSLRRVYWNNRLKYEGDYAAMEKWARDSFISRPGYIYEGEEAETVE